MGIVYSNYTRTTLEIMAMKTIFVFGMYCSWQMILMHRIIEMLTTSTLRNRKCSSPITRLSQMWLHASMSTMSAAVLKMMGVPL